MAAKKKGRVVRLTPDLEAFLEREKREGETVSDVLRRNIKTKSSLAYVLPSGIFSSLKEARGAAVIESVRRQGPPLTPVKVYLDE